MSSASFQPQLTNSRIIANFKKGGADWQLVAEELPTFLYDERAGWNEKKVWKGLFRGHILVRVSCICSHTSCTTPPSLRTTLQVALRIFRNRTAAQADRLDGWFDPVKSKKGRRCVLDKLKAPKVTRGMIAYAAIQVMACIYVDCCSDAATSLPPIRPTWHCHLCPSGAPRMALSTLQSCSTSYAHCSQTEQTIVGLRRQ